MGLNKILAVW